MSEGNETEFTCSAMGSKPAAAIKWMKGDKELQGWSRHRSSRLLFISNGNILTYRIIKLLAFHLELL